MISTENSCKIMLNFKQVEKKVILTEINFKWEYTCKWRIWEWIPCKLSLLTYFLKRINVPVAYFEDHCSRLSSAGSSRVIYCHCWDNQFTIAHIHKTAVEVAATFDFLQILLWLILFEQNILEEIILFCWYMYELTRPTLSNMGAMNPMWLVWTVI